MRTNVILKKFSDLEPGQICIRATSSGSYLGLVSMDDEFEDVNDRYLLRLPFENLPLFEDVSNSEFLLVLVDAQFEILTQPKSVFKTDSPSPGQFTMTEYGPVVVMQHPHIGKRIFFSINDSKILKLDPRYFFVISDWKITQKLHGTDTWVTIYDSRNGGAELD